MGARPADVGCLVLGRGQLDVLELPLAHGPDRDGCRGGQDGERVAVLVPGQVLDCRGVLAGDLSVRLALPMQSSSQPDSNLEKETAYLSRTLMILFSPAMAIQLQSGDQADCTSPKPHCSGAYLKIYSRVSVMRATLPL